MVEKRILHYEIREKIGEGGMGAVYRGLDTRLDRDVALKFLPPSLKADREARMRLLREAQAASKLVHANIVAIHAIEEADGQDFIVMEYVSGQTLERVIEGGTLTMSQTLELASQIADALAVAHTEGVVHRDIKASNIIVSDRGQAKILDFGLATFQGATQVTEAGSTMGTIAYMSPEQAEGANVDHRSDIFSFGVLLYEMIAGRRPFTGGSRAELVTAIVGSTPEPLARYKSDVPEALQRIIDKALRKDARERYQGAADMLADLRALRRETGTISDSHVSTTTSAMTFGTLISPKKPLGKIAAAVVVIAVVVLFGLRAMNRPPAPVETAESRRVMLAVLPFENLGEAEDDYFADGLSEEITARLAGVDGLGVIARTSVMQYKDSNKSVQTIGDELGVEYVLEGTVRWQRATGGDANRVRVTPQLIRVTDATHIWADVYDEPMTAVFQVQTRIAEGVVRELDVALLEPDRAELAEAPTSNMEAYDYYLRGKNEMNESGAYDEVSLEIAAQMFRRAIELDPEFVTAYAELSRVHSDIYWFHIDRSEERVLEARRVAERALEMDPQSPEAHEAMGWYHYHGRSDYERALEEFGEALSGRPNDAKVISGIAFVQRRQGMFEEAMVNLEKAYELDPRSSELTFSVGETMYLMRRHEEAMAVLTKGVEEFPGHEYMRNEIAWIYLYHYGDIAAARRVLHEAMRVRKTDQTEFRLWEVELCAREYATALRLLETLGDTPRDDQFEYGSWGQNLALTYRCMRQLDEARVYFEQAREELVPLVNNAPNEPRYRSALGIVYAGLGMRDEAVREGERGRELQPLSADAMKAPYRIYAMAQIFLLLGEEELATDELENLLSLHSDFNPGVLRMHPFWDPLRQNPRFVALID